jgi:arylsulfatase A-like enzyme
MAPLRKAENLNEVAVPELDRLAKGGKPFLLFLRHMDPHSPYLPPSPYDRMFYHGNACDPANPSMKPVMEFKPFCDYFASWMPEGITDKDYVIAQYDGEIAYMDACLARLFTQLETLGIAEDTIVVLNSDHGETLYDHECWFDHHGLYDNTLKVPLILRWPGRLPAGRRVSGFNQHKDLVPTLLELAGIRPKIRFDGRSLMALVRGDSASFESSHYLTECTWMRKHGWRTPQWKLIHALEPDFHFKPEVELYNLVEDPAELRNLAAEHPEVVSMLEAQMAAHIARRTKAVGLPNPIENQPGWHGRPGIDYFTSSRQAYDTLHIGSPQTAQKLQAGEKKGAP